MYPHFLITTLSGVIVKASALNLGGRRFEPQLNRIKDLKLHMLLPCLMLSIKIDRVQTNRLWQASLEVVTLTSEPSRRGLTLSQTT